jgi:release factor glutamine methyltransferase
MKVAEALAQARAVIPAAEARLLLRHVLDCSATAIAAHPERVMDESQSSRYAVLVARRAAGEPIAYLVGSREFYGRDFHVTPAVLIPRPETELLVEVALAKVPPSASNELGFADRGKADYHRPVVSRGVTGGNPRGSTPSMLDLGAGSGCVAITLALELGGKVTAVDVSPDALTVARENAARLNAKVTFIESDWYSAVDGKFDLIVGNPPYVAEGDVHLGEGDLRFEPALALACGADGLSAIRRIVAEAPRHLLPGGWLFLEHGYDQAEAVRALLEQAGFGPIEQHRDLAGIVRVSGGVLTPGST